MLDPKNSEPSPKFEVSFVVRDKKGRPTGKVLHLTIAKAWQDFLISTKEIKAEKAEEPKKERVINVSF